MSQLQYSGLKKHCQSLKHTVNHFASVSFLWELNNIQYQLVHICSILTCTQSMHIWLMRPIHHLFSSYVVCVGCDCICSMSGFISKLHDDYVVCNPYSLFRLKLFSLFLTLRNIVCEPNNFDLVSTLRHLVFHHSFIIKNWIVAELSNPNV